jgi:hypothetical protein
MVSNTRYQSTVAEDRSQANPWSSGGEEMPYYLLPFFKIIWLTAYGLSVT